MARKKIMKPTTVSRYFYKLQRQLAVAGFTPKDVETLANEATAEWSQQFGVYRWLYSEMLKAFGDRIKKGMRGLYRSALFRAFKAYQKGEDVEYVIDYFVREVGLDEGLLREIFAYFGLIEGSMEKQARA